MLTSAIGTLFKTFKR